MTIESQPPRSVRASSDAAASRKLWLRAAVTAVGFFILLAVGSERFYPLRALRWIAYDLAMSTKVAFDKPRPPAVATVVITETTQKLLDKEFQQHPRISHAALLKTLHRMGASAVVFDMVFDLDDPVADPVFAKAIRANGPVVLAAVDDPADKLVRGVTEVHNLLYPNPALREVATAVGAAHVEMDPDSTLRRFRWWVPAIDDDANDVDMPTLGVAAAAVGAGVRPTPAALAQVRSERRFLGHVVRWSPLSGQKDAYDSLIRYYGAAGEPDGPASEFAYEDVRAAANDTTLFNRISGSIKDRVVLVGNATRLGQDFHRCPVAARLRDLGTSNQMPGVEIESQILQTVLRGEYPVEPRPAGLALLALTCLFAAMLGRLASPLVILLAGAVWVIGTWAVCLPVFWSKLLWIDPSMTTLGVLAVIGETMRFMYIAEGREKRRMRRQLRRHLGRRLADTLTEWPNMHGESREVTMMFSDVQGFTSISERLASSEIVAFLNRYWGVVLPVLDQYGGEISKLMGDGMMVSFGALVSRRDHSEAAIRCAIDIQRALVRWQESGGADGLPPIRTRIGIHTGVATVGEIGMGDRVDFTAIGDVTNVASRLESANKEFGTTILVSDVTRSQAGDFVPFEYQGVLNVRGRVEPMRVYSVDAIGSNAAAAATPNGELRGKEQVV